MKNKIIWIVASCIILAAILLVIGYYSTRTVYGKCDIIVRVQDEKIPDFVSCHNSYGYGYKIDVPKKWLLYPGWDYEGGIYKLDSDYVRGADVYYYSMDDAKLIGDTKFPPMIIVKSIPFSKEVASINLTDFVNNFKETVIKNRKYSEQKITPKDGHEAYLLTSEYDQNNIHVVSINLLTKASKSFNWIEGIGDQENAQIKNILINTVKSFEYMGN